MLRLDSIHGKVLALFFLLLGIAASVAVGLRIATEDERDYQAALDNNATAVARQITDRLQTFSLVLRGAASTFADPANPLPNEWTVFTQQMQPQLTLKGVQGIGVLQRVKPESLTAHVAKVRAWGFADYAVTPATGNDYLAPILYFTSLDNDNLRDRGFDFASVPQLKATMELASDSRMVQMTAKLPMANSAEVLSSQGAVLLFPMYVNGPANANTNAAASLVGWTFLNVHMADFIPDILDVWNSEWRNLIALSIYDGAAITPDALYYTSTREADNKSNTSNTFNRNQVIEFGGHTWTLAVNASPSAPAQHGLAWLAAGSGTAISLLLYFLLNTLISVRRRSHLIAERLVHQLRLKQEALVESEYRAKFALEGTGDGVWDLNVETNTVFSNKQCKEIFGYSEGDGIVSMEEWRQRLHPDDIEKTLDILGRCISGEMDKFSSEFRLQTIDGSYKWVLDQGMVVARDHNRKALRILGTLKDISKQKSIELSLRNTQLDLLEAQRIADFGNWTLDLPSNKVRWSPHLFNMMGLALADSPPDYLAQESLFTADSWQTLGAAVNEAITNGKPYHLELEIVRPNGEHRFMLTNGIVLRNERGTITGLKGTAIDITEEIENRSRLVILTRLYKALSACNDAIVHCTTEAALLTKICEIVVSHGGMGMAWIGLVDQGAGKVVPAYFAGKGTDYLDGIDITLDPADPHGQGPTGIASRENRPIWVDDFTANPSTKAWHERALRYGWISSAAIPLCRAGKPIGSLAFYSTEPNWFTPDTRGLLEEMARNISHALDKFMAEAEASRVHASLMESEQRFRSLVEQSMIGVYIVQDHRFVYFNEQMQNMLGYSDASSLYSVPPMECVHARDRPAFQACLDRVNRGEAASFELMFAVERGDGSLIDVGTTVALSTYQQRPAFVGILQGLSNRVVAEAQIKRYATSLEKVFLQTVGMITNLVEMRDPYTVGHEMHVADLAVAIGREMQLTDLQLEGLKFGGYLHDIGKVVIPSEILSKPGRITAIEYELIKGHSSAGYQILKDVDFPWPVAEIAYQHHERLDGSGYPRGLKGNEILLEARIVAVADVVESMFSHRPYRAGLGIDKALAEIEQGRGSRYDSTVADACLRLFREKNYKMPQ